MKNHFTLLFIFVTVSLYSQSFDIGISGGYCLPIVTALHPINTTLYGNPNAPNTYSVAQQTVTPISYGNGGNIAFSMDWFSKHDIGLGLKFNVLLSAPVAYSQTLYDANYNAAYYNITDKAHSYQFIPHINFKHDFKKISPYIEMGMLVGITNIHESWNAQYNIGELVNGTQVLYGNVLLGFYSSLGLAFKVSTGVRFTLSLNCSAANYSPGSYKLTSYEVNGVNTISGVPPSSQQGKFVKQANLAGGDQPQYSVPFSNMGINLGFYFIMPHKKDHVAEQNNPNGFHGF